MKFVRCRHPEVEGEAVLPVSALRIMTGWEPVDPTEVVSTDGQTVAQVLAEVGDDPDKAAAALAVEQARQSPRSTLVERLSRIQNQES